MNKGMNKGHIAALTMTAAIVLVVTMMLGAGGGSVSLVETPSFSGHVVVTIERPSGTKVIETHNIVVIEGKHSIIDGMRTGTFAAENGYKYISLSNDSPADNENWTQLPNELNENGFTKAAGTVSDENQTEYKVSYKFTASGGGGTVQCSGLQWGSEPATDNNLWAAATFTQTTLNANDNITITWTIDFT